MDETTRTLTSRDAPQWMILPYPPTEESVLRPPSRRGRLAPYPEKIEVDEERLAELTRRDAGRKK